MAPGNALRRAGCCDHIHFDQHSRPCELIDVQERMHRLRRAGERFRAALSRLGQISHVGDVGDNLHHVVHRGAVGREQPFDLVIGIAALPREVADMPDRAAGTTLVLGSHSGEKYHLAGMGDRDDLGEQPFRSLAVIVVFLFETRASARRLRLRGQHR